MTQEDLRKQIFNKHSFLCVGLDTDAKKIPAHLLDIHDPLVEFNKAIIDATAPYCVAYKPNLAFYEAHGIHGMTAFKKTVRYIKECYPDHFIIADAKRADIGNTAKMYARAFFDQYDVDALTVAPYMGKDSVEPFLEHEGKWTIVLALTSNEGADDFQLSVNADGKKLFERVIETASGWGTQENMMFVVGATQGEGLRTVRQMVPNHFLLIPGIGAQGGSLDDVCKYAMTDNCDLLVNASRSIIYASNTEDYAIAAAEKAREIQEEMAIQLKKHCKGANK